MYFLTQPLKNIAYLLNVKINSKNDFNFKNYNYEEHHFTIYFSIIHFFC